jgi:hypothetical protein
LSAARWGPNATSNRISGGAQNSATDYVQTGFRFDNTDVFGKAGRGYLAEGRGSCKSRPNKRLSTSHPASQVRDRTTAKEVKPWVGGINISKAEKAKPKQLGHFSSAPSHIHVLSESACMSLDVETKKAHGVKNRLTIRKYTFAYLSKGSNDSRFSICNSIHHPKHHCLYHEPIYIQDDVRVEGAGSRPVTYSIQQNVVSNPII